MAKEMLKRKMKAANTSSSATKSRTPAEKEQIAQGKQTLTSPGSVKGRTLLVNDSGVTAAESSPSREKKRIRLNSGVPVTELLGVNAGATTTTLREETDARLQEQGLLPFKQDLEACGRVANAGLELFCKVAADFPTELARALQGKLVLTQTKTRHFANQLEMVQTELNYQRDVRYPKFSSENWELKEKVEKLQSVQEELDRANRQISKQQEQLKELPTTKAKAERAWNAEKSLREESLHRRESLEKLREENVDAEA